MSMSREQLVAIAQALVTNLDGHEPRLRVVTVVCDEDGEWVGVGTNTTHEDTVAILHSALTGEDKAIVDVKKVVS